MHLLQPFRRNQPPLVGGHRHGRVLCTTTLVDLLALLNQLVVAVAIIRKGVLATDTSPSYL